MAERKDSPFRIYLKNVRLSFPHLDKPSSAVEGGAEKYRSSFIIDPNTQDGKANLTNIKGVTRKLMDDTWGAGKKPRLKEDRKCVFRGEDLPDNEGETRDGYEGMMILKAATDDMPLLLTRKKKILTDPAEIRRTFYGGCRVEAMVNLYAITDSKRGGNGIFAGLNGVRFWGDDEAFGGQQVSVDDFDDTDEDDFEAGAEEDDDLGLGF